MARTYWLLALLLGLAWAGTSQAQTSGGVPIGAVSQRQFTFQPINLANVAAPMPVGSLATQQARFSLLDLFRRIVPIFPSPRPVNNLPAPASFPQYPNAFQPVAPIYPGAGQ